MLFGGKFYAILLNSYEVKLKDIYGFLTFEKTSLLNDNSIPATFLRHKD